MIEGLLYSEGVRLQGGYGWLRNKESLPRLLVVAIVFILLATSGDILT